MSWYESSLGSTGTVRRQGIDTQYVYTVVSGLRCRCYAMARNEIVPTVRKGVYEGTFGGKRYFCSCTNPVEGSGITLDQAGAMVQTPEFQNAAAQAISAELGVPYKGPLVRTEDYEERRRKNVLVIGVATAVVGVAAGVFFLSKGKKRGTNA